MSRSIILLSVVSLGCTATVADVAAPGGDLGGTVGDTAGGDGTTDGTTDGATDGTEPEPGLTLVSGVWSPTGLGVEEDPCEWNDSMRTIGFAIETFLPSEFEVNADEGEFTIEAIDYGAQGPISCTITDDDFACEQQRVSPLPYDLGANGWEYAIDFNGRATNERLLQGTAVVSFPSVDANSARFLEYLGVALEECTQVYSLEIGIES